ncbi:TonB-dependent receptor [Cellvibrio fibrivorans]|uniref:TonB-dependent receptor n=1 Tax=Cellvibrio fibrivorans TaxID=126350 RepID=A0ABU1UUF7_9GAMM|nr:TonB-dependent receptor [Cellvibrio fibrivorans]MDR7088808.1 hypothetical protein [Cellvibrio fibrivorans]
MMRINNSLAGYYFALSVTPLVVNGSANAAQNNTEMLLVENVVVYGYRTDLLGTSIAAAEGVVGSAEIAARPVSRTGEILEFVPGMVVTQHSGSGKANQYFLRGFNLDHGTDFATSVDAMPINMRSHGHGQGYTDLNFIIPELIQDIQYRKGPYYAEVGDFSGAGAAQFSLKNSLDKSEVNLTAGDFEYRRLYTATQLELDSGRLLFGVEAQRYAGPWTDIDEDVHKTNLLVRYTSQIGSGEFSLTAMGYRNRWNAADQIPLRAVGQNIIDPLGSLDTDVGGDSNRYSLSTQWVNPNWSMSAYVVDSDLNLFSNFTYFLDDPINGDEFEQVDDRQLFGGEVVRNWQIDVAGKSVTQKLGIQIRHDAIDEVGLFKTRSRNRLSTTRVDAIDETSLALFAQSDIQLTEKMRMHLGLRHDYLQVDVSSDRAENSGDASDGITNVKAGVSYSVSDNFETYFNLGQGFHSNDARGATIVIDPVSGELSEPVDLLSRSQGAEIGAKLFDNQRYSISTSLWYLALDSELLFVGDAGNTEASRASQRSGIEIASYFWFAGGWSIDSELAWTRSRFTDNQLDEGKYVDGSLPFVASAGISYSPAQTGFHGALRYRHFAARVLDSFAQQEAGATSLVNLGLGYRWAQWSVGLDILNLFDSADHDIDYFYPSRLPSEADEGVEDLHFHPVEPRSLRIRLQASF